MGELLSYIVVITLIFVAVVVVITVKITNVFLVAAASVFVFGAAGMFAEVIYLFIFFKLELGFVLAVDSVAIFDALFFSYLIPKYLFYLPTIYTHLISLS